MGDYNSAASEIPGHAQILVVGGGPSGSYAAAALAREGFDVVLLEKARFPRYHIGESMLPSCRPFLKFIGAEDTVASHGFCAKPGAAFKLIPDKREGYTDFLAVDKGNGAWNVVRSEFDEILLRHAADCGVKVFEETNVASINFGEHERAETPISATWSRPVTTETGLIKFDYLVDASGRAGIMSQKYLKNRQFNRSLDNVACWGYWTGAGRYMPNTARGNAPWFEAHSDQSGWSWFIPLHNGTTSVGVVLKQSASAAKKQSLRQANGGASVSLQAHYLDCLKITPGIVELIGDGKLVQDGEHPPVQAASDFSYAATSYAGDRFRLIGDAAAFIDPFFSSGVHLAFTDALAAAASVASSIRGDFSESDCSKYHDAKVGTAYTRFLLVVMSAYKQMTAHALPVLSDINEDNFDRAFALLRPVIQGGADTGKRLTNDELEKTMDFCKHVFAETDPEMHEAVGARVDSNLFSASGPLVTPEKLVEILGPDDEEALLVLRRVNARKVVHTMNDSTANFSNEVIGGFAVVVEQGHLGLCRK